MRQMVLALSLVLSLASSAFAYTCNATSCTWNSLYTEPATLTNGQALTDLANCTVSYTVAKDGGAASAPSTFVIPASRPQGGGAINQPKTDATMTPPHTYLVTETVACASTAFGTGVPSAPATLLMNNGVTTSGTTLTLQ